MAAPGAIMMAVARRHGIALLYRWRQDAATAALVGGAVAKPGPSFVPVVIEAAPRAPTQPRPASERSVPDGASSQAPIIEIDLAGGRTLRVTADIDAGALARIVAALEGAS